MPLPREIIPNPLIGSTVEIRYNSDIDKKKLLSLVFTQFQNELPTLTHSSIPEQIKALDPNFQFSPDYILSNEYYSLSFSSKVISFENTSDYRLWSNYFPFITTCLKKFYSLGIIKYIDRIGVRYASVFENAPSISSVIRETPIIQFENYKQKFGLFNCDLSNDRINIHLQIAGNAAITKNNRIRTGSLIDIDAFLMKKIEPNEEVFTIIEELHQEEKKLFWELLSDSFKEKLNVKY